MENCALTKRKYWNRLLNLGSLGHTFVKQYDIFTYEVIETRNAAALKQSDWAVIFGVLRFWKRTSLNRGVP